MQIMKISVTGNTAAVTCLTPVTAGTVGMPVEFTFDESWAGLTKTAVFRVGERTMDCLGLESKTTVPWELLRRPGCHLFAGVYGCNADGSLQIPTVWADLGVILPGADPTGDTSADPSAPVWQQATAGMEKTENRVSVIDENADDQHYPTAQAVGKELNKVRIFRKIEVGGSKNLFNPAAVVPNKVLSNGKAVDSTTGECISQTFAIKDGESAITISYVTGGGVHQPQSCVVAFYDVNMHVIPVDGYNQRSGSTHKIPDNAAYFIVNLGSVFNSVMHRVMVQYGDTMTAFEAYAQPQIMEKPYIKNECLDFAEVKESRNKYNYKTRTDDATMNADGKITASTYRSVSDFIPCYGESVFSASSAADGVYCFYDANKAFLSPYGVFSNGKEGIAIPANAHYLRVSLSKSSALTFVLSFTETAIPYEKYGVKYTSIQSDFDKKNCKAVISDVLASGGTIKFLGDSITQGVGGTGFAQDGEEIRPGWNVNTKGYCFANLFKNYIESKYANSVINYGTKGIRSFNIVSWLDANDGYVTDADKLLIVMIGTNNKWATTKDTLADLKNDLQWIIDWCSAKNKKLILVSAPMSTVRYDTQYTDGTMVKFHNEDIDHIYKEVCHKNNMDYVPMYQRMVEYCDLKDIDINTIFDDGLHPNDKGYYIMYKILMKELGLAYQLPNSSWDNASPTVTNE